ncbi:F-box/kelch-repeat protein [Spatholobus suberectus]|nr:F-box/kelch-repeat protein [Spatholobus suberectus]
MFAFRSAPFSNATQPVHISELTTSMKIKVPRIRYSSEEEFATLFPFDESATIGVIVYPVRGKEKSFDMWVMKDYWDEGSWVKQYTVEAIEEIYKPVGFYGSNQYLWSSFNDGLVWYDYDPESEQIKDLQV